MRFTVACIFLLALGFSEALPAWITRGCNKAYSPRICRRNAALAIQDLLLNDLLQEYRRAPRQPVSRRLLDAIRQVETGKLCENVDPCNERGDGGLALGPYQIHRVYYQDAVEFRRDLAKRPYENVAFRNFAEQVIQAYMNRYATANKLGRPPTDEDIARIHNGGPDGYKKAATLPYWDKVRALL